MPSCTKINLRALDFRKIAGRNEVENTKPYKFLHCIHRDGNLFWHAIPTSFYILVIIQLAWFY